MSTTPVVPGFLHGCDVSRWQGDIDWKRLAKRVAFAYIKCSDGLFLDSKFRQNWAAAKDAGVLRGAYHFVRPEISWSDQANFFLNALGADRGELSPSPDLEEAKSHGGEGPDTWLALPAPERLSCITTITQVMQGGAGMTPIVYTRYNWLSLTVPRYNLDCPLWIASYGNVPPRPPAIPMLQNFRLRDFTIWQHGTGNLDGVQGTVDLDLMEASLLGEIRRTTV